MKLALALVFAAPLFAQNCTYVVNPTSFSISAATTPGTVHVTQTAGSACGNYSATVDFTKYPWLTITSSGGAPGTDVTFTADANVTPNARAGIMRIGNIDVVVTQAGAVCNFGITPATQSFTVAGGTGVANIQASCIWQAVASANWITFTGATNSITSGILSYSVAANTCVDSRSGTITLQGVSTPPALTISQVGASSNLTLSPGSVTAPPAAGTGRISLSTGDGCKWTATTDVTWIQITDGSSGTGSGGISYRLLANTSVERYGTIKVGALNCVITQQAAQTPTVLKTVSNAASYATDAVSPGEIVALFGTGLGPASIVTLQLADGKVTTSLAGTQVFFDDIAAPMIYSLAGQVSAVVPYALAGKTSTQVTVKYQGSVSNALTVPVQAATPAIFTQDASGRGPGAILNQDLTVNSTGNRAAIGSVIALYCTGGGVTSPASSDGAVTADASFTLAQLPVVTIDGVNAAVKYAGAAPGSVAGLTQINVEVPAGVAPGLSLPVVVKIGDFASTAVATVSVK